MLWQTSKRKIDLSSPIVMGILNVTPDSFSDGGRFADLDAAVRRAEEMVGEGAAIIDIGGESTRPGSVRVEAQVEINRVVPVIEAIVSRFDVPVSIDTSKSKVAEAAVAAGAEIINDISGLRFDERIAEVAAQTKAGLVLMHSRGEFDAMHSQPPVDDIVTEVSNDFARSLDIATKAGVGADSIVLDVGIGFGKTLEQNLELLAKLDTFADTISNPLLVGVSRKSFVGKILDGAPPDERLSGSIAAAVAAVMNGARIIRAHDVRPTVDAIRIASAVMAQKKR
ncbi:MAG TPA: dihydropteroate synthase [Pyrinomonadaceae bacterium]|nr:dihydropteroate synthase [Pyrinomonadaceae bacterium]